MATETAQHHYQFIIDHPEGEFGANRPFSGRELLKALTDKMEVEESPVANADRLATSAIKELPEVFQPRHQELDKHHLNDLARLISNGTKLDPVLVIQIGTDVYLVDGHHRLEAYRMANKVRAKRDLVPRMVPVSYFFGSISEAQLEAGANNSRLKLPMTKTERMDFAWRLVRQGKDFHSKAQIVKASGISDGQVGNMRRVAEALPNPDAYTAWDEARDTQRKKQKSEMSQEDIKDMQERKAEEVALAMGKAIDPAAIKDHEVMAMAISRLLGHKLNEVYDELSNHVTGDDFMEDEEDEEDERGDEF